MDNDSNKPADQRDGNDRRQHEDPSYEGEERRLNERRNPKAPQPK